MVNRYGIPQIETLKSVPIPLLSKIPLIGDALFNKDIVVYFSYLLVVFLVFYYKKTIWGMSLCAVGEKSPRGRRRWYFRI